MVNRRRAGNEHDGDGDRRPKIKFSSSMRNSWSHTWICIYRLAGLGSPCNGTAGGFRHCCISRKHLGLMCVIRLMTIFTHIQRHLRASVRVRDKCTIPGCSRNHPWRRRHRKPKKPRRRGWRPPLSDYGRGFHAIADIALSPWNRATCLGCSNNVIDFKMYIGLALRVIRICACSWLIDL